MMLHLKVSKLIQIQILYLIGLLQHTLQLIAMLVIMQLLLLAVLHTTILVKLAGHGLQALIAQYQLWPTHMLLMYGIILLEIVGQLSLEVINESRTFTIT